MEGVVKYVSEKKEGETEIICDLLNVKRVELCCYPTSGNEHSFRMWFLDETQTTLSAGRKCCSNVAAI